MIKSVSSVQWGATIGGGIPLHGVYHIQSETRFGIFLQLGSSKHTVKKCVYPTQIGAIYDRKN